MKHSSIDRFKNANFGFRPQIFGNAFQLKSKILTRSNLHLSVSLVTVFNQNIQKVSASVKVQNQA